MKTDPIPKLGS